MDVQVIVTTWGHPSWAGQASRTAIPSVAGEARVYHHHEDSVASAGAARNAAVAIADPQEWICFLDADDRLEGGYMEAMEARMEGWSDLLVPALRLPGKNRPQFYRDRDIVDGLNPCPIGTLIHRRLFELAGQFWGEDAWEDWSLFRRSVLVGGKIKFAEGAVYDASNSTKSGRNNVRNPKKLRQEIIDAHGLWMNL